MSSNYEIDFQTILQNKPYLTKQEVGLILEKKGRNLDKKILNLLKQGKIILLKKGLYVGKLYYLMNKNRLGFIANILYYPSYLSLEYVLQMEGIIPEAVYAYTSVTSKLTRQFTNQLGTFLYRKIQQKLFCGYKEVSYQNNYKIKIATVSKALFDFFYFKTESELTKNKIEDFRINWDRLTKKDIKELKSYVQMSSSPKMERAFNLISKFL